MKNKLRGGGKIHPQKAEFRKKTSKEDFSCKKKKNVICLTILLRFKQIKEEY